MSFVPPLTPLSTTPLLALIVSAFLHVLALKIFPKLGLLDFPERYGLTRGRLPYPTGILIVITFLAFSPFLFPKNIETVAILSAIIILGFTCFLDDRRPLSPLLRIGIQLCVAFLLVLAGVRVEAITNPFVTGYSFDLTGALTWFSALFTVGWLLLTINALNWFDGIPGQVSTLSTIGFLTIGALSMSERVNQPALALIAFTIAGISIGAQLFDFPPPKVVMGDSGAMFFGLMIGILTIYSGGKVATSFLVLGVPLIDLLFVVIRRLRKGNSIFRGNTRDEHLHHRLLNKGWSPRQIILLTSAIGAAFGITALFLSTGGKMVAAFLLLLVMIGLSLYSTPRKEASEAKED